MRINNPFKMLLFLTLLLVNTYALSRRAFISVGAGVMKPQSKQTFSVNNMSGLPSPSDTDRYTLDNNLATTWQVAAGYEWQTQNAWIPKYSLALSYQHFNHNDIGDKIIQFSLPQFTNYQYHANVSSHLFSLRGKFHLPAYQSFHPFILGGIGLAFNDLNNYYEQALAGVTARVSPGFGDNTDFEPSFSLGLGAEYQVNQQTNVSLRYQWHYLGKLASANGVGSWSSEALHMSSYRVHSVLISVNYYLAEL